MRTLSPEPLLGPDRDPGGNSGRTPLAPMDADGDDTRMRNLSEEPAPVSTSSNLAPQAALSSTTTPAAVAGSGVGVTRNPSLRARDAFSRLRIGSFGAAPRPALPPNSGGAAAGAGAGGSSVPGSPTSDAGFSSGGSGSRRGSVATAGGAGAPLHPLPDTRHQSPAASFLSAFSPPSSAGSAGRSPSPPLPLTSHRRAAYAPFVLPPRGDERGYRLCATRDGDDDARGWEYELGRVLGQGGMGLVREAVRRRRGRGRLGARGREGEGEGEGEGEKDEGHDEDDETRVAVKIIPRRHPHFVSLAALREAMGAGALDRDHATVHLHPAPALAPSPALATPLAGSAGAAGPRRASLRGVALGVDRFGMGAGGGAGGGGDLERSRSTSSPVRPLLGMRGSSMAPLESPAPSPPAVDEALLGTSAPRLEGGYFAAIERERERGRERGGAAREGGGGAGGDADGGEVDLLDLLLQRELSLWRQLSRLVPGPGSDSGAAWRTTRWTGRGGHPHIVALLGTHRTAEFDYVFMPLAEGGTLLEYVTRPETRDRGPSDASSAASASTSSSASTPSSRSPSRRSASRGRTRDGNGNGNGTGPHATRRPRASIPIAGTASSLSPPASSSHAAPARAPQGLALPDAGEAFLQVAEAVRWLHCDAGVVHRDLKLENVVGCWEVRPLGAPPPKHEHERGRSRSKGGAKDRRSKTRRVWKLADFGLAEVMPQQAPGAGPGAAVRGVQPLAALARAGSLSRPGGAGGAPAGPAPHHSLAASVGPGAPLSSSAAAAAAAAGPGQGMSSSAFLPSPHQRPPSAALAPGAGASNSPLSALLHPVGSLPYSSPEAMRSPVPIVHPSIDMWALGCVLHALVAARLPIWDEWELRLRVRLVKGEWDVPAELDPDLASDDDEGEERAMALEVLRGCLDVDPAQRWDIRRVCDSAWLQRVRAREAEARSVAAAAFTQQQQQQQQQQQLQQSLSPTSPTATRPPSRGRPPTRGSAASSSYGFSSPSGGPPPAPSAGAREPSSTPASSAAGGTKSKSRSRTRLTTRSSSRSSAYAHQLGALGGSESQDRERRERGRSERRARWDEAASGSGTGGGGRRMRSSSRASGAATEDETAAAVAQGLRRGRSASRTGAGAGAGGRRASATGSRDSREGRDDGSATPTVLETVGEPY